MRSLRLDPIGGSGAVVPVVPAAGVLVLGALVAVVLGGCFVQQRANAACTQLIVATCEARAHCGGVDAASCRADKTDRTCDETPEAARRCVLALNDVLASDCLLLPVDLPCPVDLLISEPYDTCNADAECSVDPVPLLCLDNICSQACDSAEVRCPAQGACNVDAGRCEQDCDDATRSCGTERACINARCVDCDDACADVQCDTGNECTCGTCNPTSCDDDDDCPDDFGCNEGTCAPCRRDEFDQCVACTFGGPCPEGTCTLGGRCV